MYKKRAGYYDVWQPNRSHCNTDNIGGFSFHVINGRQWNLPLLKKPNWTGNRKSTTWRFFKPASAQMLSDICKSFKLEVSSITIKQKKRYIDPETDEVDNCSCRSSWLTELAIKAVSEVIFYNCKNFHHLWKCWVTHLFYLSFSHDPNKKHINTFPS